MLQSLSIPIPPLPIQEEIVRILDKFTALEAELEAELEARKKQYEFYRNKLLSPIEIDGKWYMNGIEVDLLDLGSIAKYRRGSFPQPYGNAQWYGGDGAMPFVQVADVDTNMQLVSETKQRISKIAQPKSVFVPKGSVVVSLQGSIGRVAITQYDSYVDRTLAIFEEYLIDINKKYFAYQLERKFGIEREFARGSTIKTITKEEFTKFSIPIPSLAEQERIVSILDRFDALVNDISIGLPAEIKARRQQYEYYRENLLRFKPVGADLCVCPDNIEKGRHIGLPLRFENHE
jgi:type I restriction enzyme S subunit